MSDNDRDNGKRSYCILKTASLEKVPRSDSQSAVINLYSNTAQSADKDIQTEHVLRFSSSEKELPPITKESSTQFPVQKKDASSITVQNCPPGKLRNKPSQSLIKKIIYLDSNEKEKERLMDPRKQNMDKQGNKMPSNKHSDLERRRLEAELKAAEEIARIRQNIIEKRLALELASIQDGNESSTKMPVSGRPSLQAELRALEEVALRKQSLMETNLAQEFETMDYQRFRPPALPAPPTSPALPPPRQSSIPLKSGPYKTESSSSVFSPIRGLGILDKKFNLDKKFSGDSGQKAPVAYPVQYTDPRIRREDTYYGQMPEPAVYEYHRIPQSHGRSHSAWKSAMAKIRYKIRNKSSNGWNDN